MSVDGAAKLPMGEAIMLNAKMRSHRVAAPPRRCSSIAPERAISQAAGHDAIDAVARSAAMSWCRRSMPRQPRERSGLEHEYLTPSSPRLVDGVDAVIAHIERYGSHQIVATITETVPRRRSSARSRTRRSCCTTPRPNLPTAASLASAVGSESHRQLHARGPVGVEQLQLQLSDPCNVESRP